MQNDTKLPKIHQKQWHTGRKTSVNLGDVIVTGKGTMERVILSYRFPSFPLPWLTDHQHLFL